MIKINRKDPVLSAILSELHNTVETPIKGYYTSSGWCKIWNCSKTQGRRFILFALEKNLMSVRKFRVKCADRVTPLEHYAYVGNKRISKKLRNKKTK